MQTVLNETNRNEIIKRIETIDGNEIRQWGKMTAHEMICHCGDQLRLSLGEIKSDYIGNFITSSIIKHLILMGMPAPKGKVETVKELKQGEGGTKPKSVAEDKKKLIELINRFNSSFPKDKYIIHPGFGKMSKKEIGKLIFIHTDYHLKQFGK